MEGSTSKNLGKIYRIDRCAKYLPRYDEKTFQKEIQYTEGQLIKYFPRKFVEEQESFQKTGYIIKGTFWALDIAFVTFCHKIKLLSRILGEKGWKMFIFKIAAVALPLNFLDQIQQDAKQNFNRNLYRGVHKFYKRYKRTGDILELNVNIVLENNETEIERICHLNEFNLVNGVDTLSEFKKSKLVV